MSQFFFIPGTNALEAISFNNIVYAYHMHMIDLEETLDRMIAL